MPYSESWFGPNKKHGMCKHTSANLQGSLPWIGAFFNALMPLIILCFFMQRHFVESMKRTGVVGEEHCYKREVNG